MPRKVTYLRRIAQANGSPGQINDTFLPSVVFVLKVKQVRRTQQEPTALPCDMKLAPLEEETALDTHFVVRNMLNSDLEGRTGW